MKKILTLYVAAAFVFGSYAQSQTSVATPSEGATTASTGIEFRTGTWAEILAMAKKENKPVFVDVFTVWCGPCKKMVAEVFPLKNIGDYFNANFVCYKFDAEKGEGKTLAKKYGINAFPTYIFVNGDGKLLYRSMGAMPADKFLQEGHIAMTEFTDTGETLESMKARYPKKKSDPAFLRAYIEKRGKSKLDNADLTDEYVSIEKPAVLLDTTFLNTCFLHYESQIRAGGACDAFWQANWDELCRLTDCPDKTMAKVYDNNLMYYSLKRAIRDTSAVLLEAILKSSDFICPKLERDATHQRLKLQLEYYAGTDNMTEFETIMPSAATAMLDEVPTCQERDKQLYRMFLEGLITQPELIKNYSPEILGIYLDYAKKQTSVDLAFQLRDLAKAAVRLTSKPELLHTAMVCIYQAAMLYENFSIYEVLAETLDKTGDHANALRQMQCAFDLMPREAEDIVARVTAKLEAMKK
ncbi:MAG: thioredoxin family protein [Tannerella sp.]|jgi:thiol-disulfide isomerase/thioredoxin|nr:thioredoxin family protein [Tannerella sp.]